MLNVAPQKERIPDHLRAMAEQDDKSAASGKTGPDAGLVGRRRPAPGEAQGQSCEKTWVRQAPKSEPSKRNIRRAEQK